MAISNNESAWDDNFVLLQDVNLAGEDWNPIGDSSTDGDGSDKDVAFTGIFDGNGHTISNLTMDKTGDGNQAYNGMFGYIKGTGANTSTGIVKGITLENASIKLDSAQTGTWKGFTGALVGKIDGGLVENSSVTSSSIDIAGNVVVDKCRADGYIYIGGEGGGLNGWTNSGNITRSSVDVDITVQGDAEYLGLFTGD